MTQATTISAAEQEQRATLAQFRQAFRKLARERKITHADILAYNLMRGLPADRGFSPIVNKNKLENGTDQWQGLKFAKYSLSWSLSDRNKHTFQERFKPSLTDEGIAALRKEL